MVDFPAPFGPRNPVTCPGGTVKDRPLTAAHFAEFEACYGKDPNGRAKRQPPDSKEDRWRKFNISEVKEKDFKLDGFKWLKDESLEDSDELPEPEELVTDAISELEAAVEELNAAVAAILRRAGLMPVGEAVPVASPAAAGDGSLAPSTAPSPPVAATTLA